MNVQLKWVYTLVACTALVIAGCGRSNDNNSGSNVTVTPLGNDGSTGTVTGTGGGGSIVIPSSLSALFALFKLNNVDNIETSGADNGGLSDDTLLKDDDKEAS